MRFAILNVSTGPNDKIKNILMSDTSLFKIVYGRNSPTYFANGRLVQVLSKNRISESQMNSTTPENNTNNRGCDPYVNNDLPENFIAVSYKKKKLN